MKLYSLLIIIVFILFCNLFIEILKFFAFYDDKIQLIYFLVQVSEGSSVLLWLPVSANSQLPLSDLPFNLGL